MEIDLLINLLANPVGILLVIFGFLVASLPWRLFLAKDFSAVGWEPLMFGYVAAAAGSGLLALLYLSFSGMVQGGPWMKAVLDSSIEVGKLCAVTIFLSLPVLGVIVAVSAWRLRRHRFTWRNVFMISFFTWVVLALMSSILPSNEWSRLHKVESTMTMLGEVLSFVLFVVLPFLATLRGVVGGRNSA